MRDLYDLLHAIKEKPAMYLGSPSVSNLFIFLIGYNFARREQGIPITTQEQKFLEFQPWLQQRFSLSTSASWARIILLYAVDEVQGFWLFFDLLTEFLQQSISPIESKANSISKSEAA
ncbi:hypothetical protein V2H45_23975 [Tumidithrix elongata RA019]|uniref:Uncharacterized protein n=1 Tax=Tumidithrix elongata BACA0141 TaxID=2716417 RepID=A0AAW9Q9C7_9CYAN|nr:hypothetical protein [Tumidithrix elongata RA019]